MKLIGFFLIIIGIIMIVYTGFDFTTKEKVLDVGPVQVTKEKNHWVQWPPIVGGVIILAGVIALASGKKNSA